MNLKKVSFFIFGISVLVILVAMLTLLTSSKPIDTKIYYTSVNVTEIIGFDLNGTALIFGNVFSGGALNRNLIITNEFDFPIILKIEINGTISPLLISESGIRIENNKTKKISFSARVPDNYSNGFYDGYVKIDFFKAKES